MDKNIGVYQIELNGKKYVGSTALTFKERWYFHLQKLRKGNHKNRHLQSAFNKYGEENLKFSILEIVRTSDELIIAEQWYIDELKPEYNIRKVANDNRGIKFSNETKAKMSKAQMGNKKNLGRKLTEEIKQKISEANKGKVRSEETKHKISENSKLQFSTKEARQKLGEVNKGNKYRLGIKCSEESRRKMTEAKKGNKGRLGQKLSEEHKQKLRVLAKKSNT